MHQPTQGEAHAEACWQSAVPELPNVRLSPNATSLYVNCALRPHRILQRPIELF